MTFTTVSAPIKQPGSVAGRRALPGSCWPSLATSTHCGLTRFAPLRQAGSLSRAVGFELARPAASGNLTRNLTAPERWSPRLLRASALTLQRQGFSAPRGAFRGLAAPRGRWGVTSDSGGERHDGADQEEH